MKAQAKILMLKVFAIIELVVGPKIFTFQFLAECMLLWRMMTNSSPPPGQVSACGSHPAGRLSAWLTA